MPTKSQSVIVSEKKRRNNTGKYKAEHKTDFEQRLKPTPEKKRRAIIDEAFEYYKLREDEPKKLKRYSIERFCVYKGISQDSLEDWAKQDEYLRKKLELCKMSIGVRIEDGMLDKEMSEKGFCYLHNYLKRKQRDDDREDTRKIKLSNEGVSEGQIKVVVVNENIKIQEPE